VRSGCAAVQPLCEIQGLRGHAACSIFLAVLEGSCRDRSNAEADRYRCVILTATGRFVTYLAFCMRKEWDSLFLGRLWFVSGSLLSVESIHSFVLGIQFAFVIHFSLCFSVPCLPHPSSLVKEFRTHAGKQANFSAREGGSQ
jgi:hypothetical protein